MAHVCTTKKDTFNVRAFNWHRFALTPLVCISIGNFPSLIGEMVD